MEKELAILELADYKERIEYEDASCYLIVNNKLEQYPCMFGFVKMSENYENTRRLFEKAENRARQLGYRRLIGPLNYNTWMSYRWAISGFDEKYFPDCDNEEYYIHYIKRLGYKELYTYRSAHVKMNNPLYDKGKAIYCQKLEEGYEFRFYHGDEAYQVVKDVYEVSVDAFRGSYLYSDIPYEYFQKIYLDWTRQIKGIALYMAYKGDCPVGYAMGYVNPYHDQEFISKTSAVLKEHQKHGLYAALVYLGCKYVETLGFDEMVYHFQCEQRKTFKRFAADMESKEKRYAVFVKEL